MNHSHWMGFSRTAIAVAVAVVAAAPALAQNTTSAVGGTVTGADGKPVAAATVTILHVESGSTNTVSTDAQGRYAARGLRAGGPYTITISKGGLSDKQEGVFLNVAESGTVNAQLGAGAQTVVITGRGASDQFNRSNMGAGTNIGSRELAAFASIQRNLADYARTDPRLAQTDKDRGEISAAGQNTRFNSITIDGVNISDTFGLEANGLPTIKQPISIDAIQSVQVNISNYDVTQKGYVGANINAVTKSGTNDFKGSLYYVWRDDSVVGQRRSDTTGEFFDAPKFKDTTKGFTLGGPIIKDTLFFFANYEELKSSRISTNFGPVGSATTNVGITQSAIDQAITIANDTWGIDVGSPGGTNVLNVKDTLLKLDWNISDNHRANVRYTRTKQNEPILAGFSATGLSLSSWWWNQAKDIESVVGQWFADWTPNFSTEVKFSKRNYNSVPTPVNGQRLPAIGLNFTGNLPIGSPVGTDTRGRFLNFGTELSRQFNVLDTNTTDAYVGGTYTLGEHELKAGVDYQDNDIFNAFLQNVNGNYTFRCEGTAATATSPAGSPVTYSFGTVGGPDNAGRFAADCNALTSAQRDLAVLENFARGNPSSYTVQLPLQGHTLQDSIAKWSYANTGFMLQDTWAAGKNLNLTMGVRIDRQNVPTKPLLNVGAAAAPVAGTVAGTTYTRATGGFGIDNSLTLDNNVLVQPRFGFNWNPGFEQRSQVRGGFGLFQGAAASVWLSNPFSNTGAATGQFSCTNFNNCRSQGVTFNPNPDAQPTPTGNPAAAAVDALSPGLKQPSVWKANLAFETELPALPVVGTLVAGAEWLHTETQSGIFYQHLNLGAPTATGTDGRDIFYRAEGLNPNCYSVATDGDVSNVTTGACATPSNQSRTRALSNRNFANVLLAKETGKGYGNVVTLSLNRPLKDGLSYGVAYTRTVAKEVSPLTSSTSNSNWLNRSIFNPNEETLANSNFTTRDRYTANLSWSKAFVGNYRTTFGAFYEGRSGKPYSWTYINDLNGDGITGNDLMFIPTAPGSGEVVFRGGAEEEARFFAIVDANKALRAAKGGVVGRNKTDAPWVNNVDVRFSQELPGVMRDHKVTFVVDILNFGNLLNRKWGRISEITFPSNRSFVNFVGLEPDGRYRYSLGTTEALVTRQTSGESQWALQATLRYEF